MALGAMEHVMPEVAEQLRLTAALNPYIAEVVKLVEADPPTPRVTEGVALTRRVGAVVTVTVTDV